MTWKTRLTKGFQKKASIRTKKEVDEEYTKEAIWLGHKTRMLAQLQEDCAKLQSEVDGHLKRLLELNSEGMKIPPESIQDSSKPDPVPEPTPQGAA